MQNASASSCAECKCKQQSRRASFSSAFPRTSWLGSLRVCCATLSLSFSQGLKLSPLQTYGVELTLLPAVGELPIPAAGEPTLCMQPVPQASRTAVTRAPARYRPSAGRTPEVSPRPPRSSCQRCRASLTSASTPRWSHLIESISWCTTMPGPPRPVSKDQSCAKRLSHWQW